ncbi:hypothetical protein M901_2983, partial [Bacteriovorax sp. DB6_IX]
MLFHLPKLFQKYISSLLTLANGPATRANESLSFETTMSSIMMN